MSFYTKVDVYMFTASFLLASLFLLVIFQGHTDPIQMTVTDIKSTEFSVAVELDNEFVVSIQGNHAAWLLILDTGIILELQKPSKLVTGVHSDRIKVVKNGS